MLFQHLLPYISRNIVMSKFVCLSVCFSVCLSFCLPVCFHISKTARPISNTFLCMLQMAVPRFSSWERDAISYIRAVLWMTSSFHIMREDNMPGSNTTLHIDYACQVAAPVGHQTTSVWSIYQNLAPGAKSAIYDFLVKTWQFGT